MTSPATSQFKRAIKDRDFVLRERDRLSEDYLGTRMDEFIKLLDGDRRDRDTFITAFKEYSDLPAELKVMISLVIEKGGFDYAELRGNLSKEFDDAIDYINEHGFYFYVDYRVHISSLWWATLVVLQEYLPPLLKNHIDKIAEEYADKCIEKDLYCRLVQLETKDLIEGK